MKKTTIIALMLALPFAYISCKGSNNENNSSNASTEETTAETEATAPESSEPYDPSRGEGNYDQDDFEHLTGIDKALADKGHAIAESKCFSCHKTTDERLVGPGWKGVTQRRTPQWIMNFISNPDPMIDKDPEVQKQLEQCLVRMPNQNLSHDEARAILEYMRQNDGAA